MAKKITGYVKLQLPAGKANPSPPVGPALGQHGVNIMAFCKDFNARTATQEGMIIPVVITVYSDRSFTFITEDAAGQRAPARRRRGSPRRRSRARARRSPTRSRWARSRRSSSRSWPSSRCRT